MAAPAWGRGLLLPWDIQLPWDAQYNMLVTHCGQQPLTTCWLRSVHLVSYSVQVKVDKTVPPLYSGPRNSKNHRAVKAAQRLSGSGSTTVSITLAPQGAGPNLYLLAPTNPCSGPVEADEYTMGAKRHQQSGGSRIHRLPRWDKTVMI